MRTILALLAAFTALPALAQPPPYTTMSHEGLRTGVIAREADCPDQVGFAWVSAPYPDGFAEGACIRYYAAGLEAFNQDAVVFIHGNRLNYVYDEAGRVLRIGVSSSYGTPSEAAIRRAAEAQARAIGHPFIIVARPGNYGSSGIASEQYRRREGMLVNAALDVIKRRHAIASFAVSAQSGGGPSLAGMLAYRDDLRCAVFSSSLTNIAALQRRAEERGQPSVLRSAADLYDPIQQTNQVRRVEGRRIFVVGDEQDALIPFAAQEAYAEALRRQGFAVVSTASLAVGDNRHSLGATGQRAAGWCLDGLPDAVILARMQQGEAVYLISGGFY